MREKHQTLEIFLPRPLAALERDGNSNAVVVMTWKSVMSGAMQPEIKTVEHYRAAGPIIKRDGEKVTATPTGPVTLRKNLSKYAATDEEQNGFAREHPGEVVICLTAGGQVRESLKDRVAGWAFVVFVAMIPIGLMAFGSYLDPKGTSGMDDPSATCGTGPTAWEC